MKHWGREMFTLGARVMYNSGQECGRAPVCIEERSVRERRGVLLRSIVACGAGLVLSGSAVYAETVPNNPERLSFPTYGVSFVPPAGWVANPCATFPNIAQYRQ